MITTWTHDQWVAFAAILAAGVGALGLAALAIRHVRAWTAPAGVDAVLSRREIALRHARGWALEAGYEPRPTLQLAAQRITNDELDESRARWQAIHAADATATLAPHVDPTGDEITAHLAPGPGSLTDLAEVGPGAIVRITHADLIDPEVHRWFAEAFDRPAHVPKRTEAAPLDEGGVLTRFHTATEAAFRKARRWEIEGRGLNGHTSGRTMLDAWRAGTDTGAWPVVVPVGGRLPAALVGV